MTFSELKEKVKGFEGWRGSAYADPVGVKTIAWGFTAPLFKDGKVPSTITKEEAEPILNEHLKSLQKNVESLLDSYGYHYNEEMVYPLVDFAYNLGMLNVKKLTCGGLRSWEEIIEKIPAYNKAGGKVLKGLVLRREWEARELSKAYLNCKFGYSPTAKDIQRLINEKFGYELDVDGDIGKKTRKAIFDILMSM